MTGMTADDDYLELLQVLSTIAEGGDADAAVRRILELLPSAVGPAWVRELAYVARHYSSSEPATGTALVALARRAIARYPCPACEQVVLDEPAWSDESSASDDICPSCGIQFGYQDAALDSRELVYERWRESWLANGRRPIGIKPRDREVGPP